jgi:hypothetical protein
MLEVAGGILLVFLALGLLVAAVDAFAVSERKRHPDRPLVQAEASPREGEEPTSMGLDGLGEYLDRRKTEDQANRQREEDRLNRLMALWQEIDPIVRQAVELVNSKLAPHQMYVELSPLDFFGQERSAFGAMCKLHIDGQSSLGLPYDGEQCVAVTGHEGEGERLYAGGCHRWSEGIPLLLKELAADKLANVIADGVKSFLEG